MFGRISDSAHRVGDHVDHLVKRSAIRSKLLSQLIVHPYHFPNFAYQSSGNTFGVATMPSHGRNGAQWLVQGAIGVPCSLPNASPIVTDRILDPRTSTPSATAFEIQFISAHFRCLRFPVAS